MTILVSTLLREGGHEMNNENEIPVDDQRCASTNNARSDFSRKRNSTTVVNDSIYLFFGNYLN